MVFRLVFLSKISEIHFNFFKDEIIKKKKTKIKQLTMELKTEILISISDPTIRHEFCAKASWCLSEESIFFENMKQYFFDRFLAKTLRVNKTAIKSFSKISNSESTLNCMSVPPLIHTLNIH